MALMDDVATVPLSPARKAIMMTLIMATTVMVILDTTIANVALPHMQAALGASPDSVSWVLTSYILASAVATPMTGWLAGRFGRKRLFGAAVIGFTASSMLCGVSATLQMMVFARVLQGIFGAFLMPMTQAFLYDMYTKAEQVRALMIWGMGVMLAPIAGPIIGGYLTESYNWRWVFFINVPIGIAVAFGILTLMPDFPSFRRKFDRMGFLIMLVALSALQLLLDRGTQQDWLNSPEILIEAGLCLGGFWMLINHLRDAAAPILPAALFRDRNFVVALLLIFIVGAILTAGSTLLPPMLQSLFNYPVLTAGVLVVPRGVGMLISMMVAGRLLSIIDTRILILIGMSLTAISLWMMTGFSLSMGQDLILWSGLVQGIGMGLVSMPMNLMSVSTLSPSLRTEGAALYSLSRSVGGSVAIAITTALLTHYMQVNHAELGAGLRLPFLTSGIVGGMGSQGSTLLAYVNAEVTRQAMMIAYINDYWLMMWATILLMPMVLVMRPARPVKGEPMHVSE
jgi:DHA2 family multidrug resistance protein